MKPMYSRKMRLPGSGALGLISSAGMPVSADIAVTTVTPTVQRSDTPIERMKSGMLVAKSRSVKPYIIR